MALFGTGSTAQYYKRAFQGNLGNEGLTISLWVKGVSTGTTSMFALLNGTSNHGIYNYGPAASIYMQQADANSQSWSSFDTNLTGGGTGWSHLLMSIPQSGTVVPYMNSVTGGLWTHQTNTTPTATSNWTEIDVCGQSGSNAVPTTTLIAEVAIWRTGLSQGQVTTLRGGENPLRVAPGKLMDYWPLRNSLANFGQSGVGLTPQGGAVPVYGEHPLVVPMPRRRWLYHVAAAAAPTRRPFITIAA